MASAESEGIFSRIGTVITKTRNFVLNTLFVIILIAIIAGFFTSSGSAPVPDKGALVIDPRGILVEERTFSNPLDNLWNFNYDILEAELGEITRAIELAENDSQIEMIILDLEGLGNISLAQGDRIIDALLQFKNSEKTIASYANGYMQSHYYVSSVADELYLNPMGSLMIDGFGGSNLYFKDFLDRYGFEAHVYRVGDYKEAVEPFIRNDMSEESKEVNMRMLDKLWAGFSEKIEKHRNLESGSINRYGVGFAEELKKTKGDFARAAIENNLVDELLTWDQARVRFGERVGFQEDETINSIDYQSYLLSQDPDISFSSDKVAVINIQGPIFLGSEGMGATSADTAIQLIREARRSEEVVAIVVRVDSPGGSAFASEMIRLELELAQIDGIPVVASFASVAASGGYWLSATSDYIFAEPNTVTGSIGVFSVLFTAEKAASNIGIQTDGVATTPFSQVNPFTKPNPQLSEVLQLSVEHGYNQFVELVARGRGLERDLVTPIAQGKVWLGTEAVENGLADDLGSLPEALNKAAELAQSENWSPLFMKKPIDPRDAFLAELLKTARVGSIVPETVKNIVSLSELDELIYQVKQSSKLQALCDVCVLGLR